ncbi:MAG: hypothetical protein HRU69_02740 [Flammeovirgaceae bacterium]|nr:MAG: hypothetical protein HRU69_02740 [Flammeovirgaceae bacterium]
MEDQGFVSRAKTATMKFVKRLLLILLGLGLAVTVFMYFGVFERGVMAGKVLRIAEKGVIFKTYEGQLSREAFGSLKGTSPLAETYDFSVESSEAEVLKELQAVALTGERVNLHFVKRYMKFPWRGDTRVFVTRVERGPQP